MPVSRKQDDKTIKQREKTIVQFWKEAMCVDGDVKLLASRDFKIEGVIELNDSERGRFYLASVVPK